MNSDVANGRIVCRLVKELQSSAGQGCFPYCHSNFAGKARKQSKSLCHLNVGSSCAAVDVAKLRPFGNW